MAVERDADDELSAETMFDLGASSSADDEGVDVSAIDAETVEARAAAADDDVLSSETMVADVATPLPTAARLDMDVDDDVSSETMVAEPAAGGAGAETMVSAAAAATENVVTAAATSLVSGSESSIDGDSAAYDDSDAVAGDRIGEDFEIIRTIGVGGMGTVYLARDLRLGRRVAIKVMRLGGHDSKARTRLTQLFLSEARATARLNHPNVVTIHQVGQWRGQPYLVLELLDGDALSDRIAKGRPSVTEAIRWMAEICRGLIHAHGQGLVHRDLKPQNVFLTEDGQVKVVDFGLATFDASRVETKRVRHSTMSDLQTVEASGTISGSPAYMAPEQWRGQAQDERTDIWACGVMFYQLLVGALPFAKPPMILTDSRVPLPSQKVDGLAKGLDAIVERCLQREPEARFASARELLEALLAIEGATRKGQGGEPYRFLEAFGEADSGWFFGRDRESAQLANMAAGRALVAIVGPSGAGKSSLARAGLLGRLRQQDDRWQSTSMVPGRTPLATLRQRLHALAPASYAALGGDQVDLAARPGFLGEVLRHLASETGSRVMLLVDQFEELFTLDQTCDERAAFAAALLSAADDPAVPVRVVVTMRDDFLSALAETPALRDAIVANLLALGPPDAAALQRSLVGPAAELGYAFEPGLAESMVEELRSETAPLPLLQFAASRLWEARDTERHLLTRSALEAMGGLSGVLASHAESVLSGMDDRDVQLARVVLCGLVTPAATRRAIAPSELAARASDSGACLRVVDRLVAGRLLAVIRTDGEQQVQLAHESLIVRWERLHHWLGDDADRRLLRERIAEATRHWQEAGELREMLWGGEPLARALAYEPSQLGLHPQERAFLDASAVAERKAGQIRRLLVGIGIATALAITIGSWLGMLALGEAADDARAAEAVAQQSAAAAQKAEAHAKLETQRAIDARRDGFARVLAAWADSRLATEPMSALLLAREAAHLRPSGPALDALHRALQASSERHVLRHERGVSIARWLQDGSLVSVTSEGVLRLLRDDGAGKPPAMPKVALGAAVPAIAIDRAQRVWLGDANGGVWRLQDRAVHKAHTVGHRLGALAVGDDVRVVVGHGDEDGTIVALAGSEAADVPLRVVGELPGHQGGTLALHWLPGSDQVVSAGTDGAVRTGRFGDTRRRQIGLHRDAVVALAGDVAGRVVAAASLDGSGSIYRDGVFSCHIGGHDGWVTAIAVDAKGAYVATGSNDESIRLWHSDGTFLTRIDGHDYGISSLRFAHHDNRLLSVSLDGTAAVWAVDGKQIARLAGHEQPLFDGDWSNDDERILTASEDGTARVWATRPSELARIDGPPCEIGRVSLSPDGRSLLAWGEGDLFEACQPGPARWAQLDEDHIGPATAQPVGGDGQTVVAGLLLDGDHALLGDSNGGVRAFARDGSQRGATTLGAGIAMLLPTDKGAWAVATSGELARVDAEGKRLAVLAGMPGGTLAAAAVCDDGVVRAFADGRVDQFGTDGAPVASQVVTGPAPTALACARGRVAIGFADGKLQVGLGDTASRWQAHPEGVAGLAWAASGAIIASVGRDGHLAAWSGQGELRWRRDLGFGALAGLHDDAVGGALLAFAADGHFAAVGLDGAPLSSLSAPTGLATSLSLASRSGDVALVVRGVGAFVAPLRAGNVLALAELRRGRSLSDAERAAYGLSGVVDVAPATAGSAR